MNRRLCEVVLLLACVVILLPLAIAGQTHETSSPSSATKPPDVSGKWQASWQGRIGTEQCTLQLHQEGTKLTGTFQDQRGLSSLSGGINGNKISFEVQFQGPRPFTTRFTGTVDKTTDADKIEGSSQAVGIGGAGAYMGHAGEIVQPEHPWTAKRLASQPAQSSENGSNPPAKN